MVLRILVLTLGILASLSALEMSPETKSYLSITIQPVWRNESLLAVLREIGKDVSKPLVLSPHLEAPEAQMPAVVFIAEKNMTTKEVIEILERTQNLHVTAENGRLLVETKAEWLTRVRRPVRIDLHEYGILTEQKNHWGPVLAMTSEQRDKRREHILSLQGAKIGVEEIPGLLPGADSALQCGLTAVQL